MSKRYSLIIADCPWTYDNRRQCNPKFGGITYPVMSMEDLAALPVYKAAEDNAILAFWVTGTKLVDNHYEKTGPLEIMRAWNFRPVTIGFIWIKTNHNATVPEYEELENLSFCEDYDEWYSGLGSYVNTNAEYCIFGRRGKALERKNKNVKQHIFAPINGHSEKPQTQYNRLLRLFGNVPSLELFARKQNPPPDYFDATGLDFDGVDIRDWIKKYE